MDSQKISRLLFLLVGVLVPIFIGLLHTYAHFKDLMQPHVEVILSKEITVMGEPQILMHTLGVVSFMMGASFITIGLLNMAWIKSAKTIPAMAYLAMALYQLSVIYVGANFEQGFQLYGGSFGLLVLIISFILSKRK